ncbi:MAG: 1-(5-phosphoribosyl)-5-[(5-phosphoribosylamino)methylideneamino]imidazole-4-carboxamide isomerase [Deltaproteobacteria bacterium]|nr:1-(5-phosphoribosyl)-5-[(5-phosphoribosylamino)methylideneamino]imidazole-4-carboxamide isomerase [Deltaproteobacteria bacterium]MBW2041697.1 1-(5-phosphoribosyl)-5-[(5-phosphoribosylamino)methylideneamino]imidazole-4-carboxamide isomerase [Deltaproteobacteria bacterium]
MIIIPAIDIKGGKCVRLKQGRREEETVFSNDPVQTARHWVDAGAEWLHVVDLDGAFEKCPVSQSIVKRIRESVRVPIQVGGGIRDEDAISMYMDMGVDRVILGTTALSNPDRVEQAMARYPGRIAVGIDAKEGWVAVEGWTRATRIQATALARRFDGLGLSAIIFTDIHRDGMQTGPNIEATRAFASAISTPVIASGGVSSLEDIRNLLSLEHAGVAGVITGKALYSGSLDLAEAIRIGKRHVELR